MGAGEQIFKGILCASFITECTKRDINLVFLFDGSGSMKSEEFILNKNFIRKIMTKLSNSSIKVKLFYV